MTTFPELPGTRHQSHSLIGERGVRLWYGSWRTDDPGVSPRATVVVTHGFGEHTGRYHHLITALTRAGYVVVAGDLRGHGRSGGSRHDVITFDDYVADLSRIIWMARRDDVDRPVMLFGHSMGGLIALRYLTTIQDPTVIAGAIFSSPAVIPSPDLSPLLLWLLRPVVWAVPRLPLVPIDPDSLTRDQDVRRRAAADPLVNQRRVRVRLAYELNLASHVIRATAHRLTVPFLLMYGEDDTLTAPAGAQVLAERASSQDITVCPWPGLRHELLNEPEHEQVIDAIIEWLASDERSARGNVLDTRA